MLALLLLALQGGPTVGDTVWITQDVQVGKGVSVRPRPVNATPAVEPLGPPEVIAADRVVTVRYPLVFWKPGKHSIELPGVILVRADGWSDTLSPAVASVEVRSVLPGPPSDSIKPAPPQRAVARSAPALLPLLVLLALAILLLLPLHWWWLRRGRRARAKAKVAVQSQSRPARDGSIDTATIRQWTEAGELRVAAEAWAQYLEPRLAARDDPALHSLIQRLREARFSSDHDQELAALLQDAERAAQGV